MAERAIYRGLIPVVGLLLLSASVSVHAIPITVLNHSFESPDCDIASACTGGAANTYSVGDITNWVSPANTGVWDYELLGGAVPNVYYDVTTPDGDQVAYSNGSAISQQLSESLMANHKYTLTVEVGSRKDANSPGYDVILKAGSTTLTSASELTDPLTVGDFTTVMLMYTAPSFGAPGGSLEIVLDSDGVQTNWDNVRLEKQQVPEPTTLALMGLGLAGIGFGRYRSKNSHKKT